MKRAYNKRRYRTLPLFRLRSVCPFEKDPFSFSFSILFLTPFLMSFLVVFFGGVLRSRVCFFWFLQFVFVRANRPSTSLGQGTRDVFRLRSVWPFGRTVVHMCFLGLGSELLLFGLGFVFFFDFFFHTSFKALPLEPSLDASPPPLPTFAASHPKKSGRTR